MLNDDPQTSYGLRSAPEMRTGTGLSFAAVSSWTVKSGVAILDQGMYSGSNLVLNILLARWLTGSEYGTFAVAFSALLLLSGFHNALVLEPMSVLGPAKYVGQQRAHLLAQLKIHFVLCGALTAMAVAVSGVAYFVRPHESLWSAILGCGVAIPSILLLWLTRRHCYCRRRPLQALFGSMLYSMSVLGGVGLLFWSGKLSSLTAYLLMGVASLVGAGASLAQNGLTDDATGSGPCTATAAAVVRENWRYGRWLLGSTILYSLSTQIQTFFAAAVLGFSAAGVLRAATLPMLAMAQCITAVTTLALPTLAADFGRGDMESLRRKTNLLTLTLTAVVLVGEVALFAFSSATERLLYHGRFSSQSWLLPMLGLVALFTAASSHSLLLRAIQRPESNLIFGVVAAPVGIISALLFTEWWGIAGAAGSMVLTAAVGPVVYFALYKRWFPRRSVALTASIELLSPVRTNGAH